MTMSTDSPNHVRLRASNGHRIYDEEQGPTSPTNGHRIHDKEQELRIPSGTSEPTETASTREKSTEGHHIPGFPDKVGLARFWHRFMRKGRTKVGFAESLKAIAFSSCNYDPSVFINFSTHLLVWQG